MSDSLMDKETSVGLAPVLCVVGARPNFIKMAPILRAMKAHVPPLPAKLVHTGQHYDADMCDRIFDALQLPQPDVNLNVRSATHAVQIAHIMERFEPVVDAYKPSCVAVVGDVNSTLACSLVACKKGVPLVHIESGLRSRDRNMPEEINRILTDQMSDRLYTTERDAHANLQREGIESSRALFVGNVMIDSLRGGSVYARSARDAMPAFQLHQTLLGGPSGYAVVTLHRPSNVDDRDTLLRLLDALGEVASRIPVVFVMHPRTRSHVERFGFMGLVDARRMLLLPPIDYLEMLGLVADARVVLTDSGGLQEETTALGVPCLTLRDTTERPITVACGSNTLVGTNRHSILDAVQAVLAGEGKRGRIPEYWDGHAAQRIVDDLYPWLLARHRMALPNVQAM